MKVEEYPSIGFTYNEVVAKNDKDSQAWNKQSGLNKQGVIPNVTLSSKNTCLEGKVGLGKQNDTIKNEDEVSSKDQDAGSEDDFWLPTVPCLESLDVLERRMGSKVSTHVSLS